MQLGKLGVWCFLDAMPSDEVADAAVRIEQLGYGALWIPEAVGREVFASASFLLARTSKLIVASGIANIYARDAMTMANGRRTLAEQSRGRFLLGIGVSHRPLVQGLRGHDYSRPYSMMRDYLEAMERAPYTSVPPTEAAPIVIGALHPKMLELASHKTAGVHPYLVPPEHTAFARQIVGPSAWICTEQQVLLETDPAKARGVARNAIAMYLDLPNYRRSLERFGFGDDDFHNMGSDRLVDAIVAWGDEKAIAARIQAHHDAGADHVCIQPLHPLGLPMPDWRVLEAFAPSRS
jgi:probable F420-dependent oxidoreductase